jgi:hypothetical protein
LFVSGDLLTLSEWLGATAFPIDGIRNYGLLQVRSNRNDNHHSFSQFEGFGVIMINFHGSTSYGQNFTDSITGMSIVDVFLL